MISVLIVDDHTMFRKGLREVLARAPDITVGAEAADGRAALEEMRKGNFNVVLLDIQMEGRGGLDILDEIRRLYPDTGVLMLSMHPVEQYGVRAVKRGALGYLTKERTPYELIDAIRVVASGRRYVDPALAEQLAENVGGGGTTAPHETLSDRELRVMLLLARGRTVREIAEELCLSPNTVSTYRARILSKMRLRNNAELAYYAVKEGLLS